MEFSEKHMTQPRIDLTGEKFVDKTGQERLRTGPTAAAGQTDARWQLVAGRQAAHLQRLGRLDQAGQLGLGHRRFALVHEVEDALHLPAEHVFQHDDRVFAGVLDEDRLEVGAAGGEEHLVGAHAAVLAHDRAVDQRLILIKKQRLL